MPSPQFIALLAFVAALPDESESLPQEQIASAYDAHNDKYRVMPEQER